MERGQEVVEDIQRVATGENDKPKVNVRIKKAGQMQLKKKVETEDSDEPPFEASASTKKPAAKSAAKKAPAKKAEAKTAPAKKVAAKKVAAKKAPAKNAAAKTSAAKKT